MVKITGDKKHSKRLKRMISGEMTREIVRALYITGQKIELGAEHSITEGSVSGKNHVPSLPGQPPNADTRTLDTNIETSVVAQNPPTVHVTSHAPYSAALEFGTSKMAERPFMRPQLKRTRPAEFIRDAINGINRRPV